MDVFSDVYKKSRELAQTPALHENWQKIGAGLKALLQPEGPAVASAGVLDTLRAQVDGAAKGKASQGKARAAEILRAADSAAAGYQDRAALIKQMQHFYLAKKKGGQTVWVVDSPKDYGKWTYDLFAGKSEEELKAELAPSREVFGDGNRRMMSDALQLARKWSSQVEVKLSGKSKATMAAISKWFFAPGAEADDIEAARAALLDGFKKITATCNSGTVIFSDRPKKRADGSMRNTFASVNSLDAMAVIYIYELFLRTGKKTRLGNIPKLWLCALTIVHELSHKLIKTEDIRYDYDGLRPGDAFPSDQALKNADSWAYFAGDLIGAVPASALKEALG